MNEWMKLFKKNVDKILNFLTRNQSYNFNGIRSKMLIHLPMKCYWLTISGSCQSDVITKFQMYAIYMICKSFQIQ